MQAWNPEYAIFAGDWNVCLNPDMDTKGYQNLNNPRARLELLKQINDFELQDIFRELNPTLKKFSWKKWDASKYARLDYFLISNSLLPFVRKTEILSACYSDHCPILLEIDFSKFQRGRGFWKLNNSLLQDNEYVNNIKNVIKRVTCRYAIIDNDPNFFDHMSGHDFEQFLREQTPESLQNLPLTINPELFLETLLLEIRGITIQFAARKKKSRVAEEQKLVNDIEILENHLDLGTTNEEMIKELDSKKVALENLYKYQAQGAYVRSRANYKIEGERPTKLFCNLEKYNGVQKFVPQLIIKGDNDEEKKITEQRSIENEIYTFYKKLYENRDMEMNNNSIEQFLEESNVVDLPKVTESQKMAMEGNISLIELSNYLKKSKNNVSPGSSGYTNEFYKFFWRDIKQFVIKAVNYAFEKGRLAASQKLGIITIIPKGEKDKRFLNNWRPITLLNTLYKLVSGCIAERMKPVLDRIIHPDQKGFVPGRYIGEAIRSTYDILQHAKEKQRAGLLLCIDFEKAYDSISFQYIKKCLKFYNFGPDLIKWVEMLLYDFTAVINHCGNISNYFSISRGCRQGDPIASYLFIICIEILAVKLRGDSKIEAFCSENLSHLLEIYADDLSVSLNPSSANLYNTIKILQEFYALSGLKISVSKTTAIWFGSECDSDRKLCENLNLQWSKTFTLLGIHFDNKLEKMQSNFEVGVSKIEKLLSNWSYRFLTPFGKVTVLKSLALSKISHIALVIPNPSKDMLKRLNSTFHHFLWDNKSEKICRLDAKLPLTYGGIAMPDIASFWKAFKFSWLRRLLATRSFWPNILLNQIRNILSVELSVVEILQLGSFKLNMIAKKIKNPFWKEVFGGIKDMIENAAFCFPEKILSSPFFYNNLVLRGNKVIREKDFPELTRIVGTLSDFYLPNTTTMLSRDEFCERYTCDVSVEKYIDIRYVISVSFLKLRIDNCRLVPIQRPYVPFLIDVILSSKRGCRPYNRILQKKACLSSNIQKRESKWHNELGTVYSLDFWSNSRKLYSEVYLDNKLRWLQYQIVRNSLQTNVVVSHFKVNVSRLCSYCHQADELISHLFWSCSHIQRFLDQLLSFLSTCDLQITPSRTNVLFGYHDLPYYHPKNFILLLFKKFVWTYKFRGCQLDINRFKSYMNVNIVDLKFKFDIKGEGKIQ